MITSGPLVESTRELDPRTHLVILLGGEAGMRCGEMIALEWTDVDLANRQLSVRRSDWNGHVTVPKGGRIRHVPVTRRPAAALSEHRHLRSTRVLVRTMPTHSRDRSSRRAQSERRAAQASRRTRGPVDDSALHASEPGGTRRGDSEEPAGPVEVKRHGSV